ncbi:MAG: cyclic lactone autoinducer peptide [Eubacterium sp.]|nr:cyclic lactone autoinducer peptide [Eubacterium sp.]
MKVSETVAKVIAKLALKSAKAACGAASCFGPYQPKEPTNLKDIVK